MVDAADREGERDRGQVLEEDRDDLAEAEGHDRQVVTAQAQGRGAQQRAERRGDDGREREDDPERQVDARGSPAATFANRTMLTLPKWGEAKNAAV